MMHTFRFLLTVLCILSAASARAQSHPDSILVGNRQLPEVLLVGTFHFAYPNLDAHKTGIDDQVNIHSAQKQKEVEELVDYLALFRPTKIVVEAGRNTGYLLRQYERWRAGEDTLRSNEAHQLVFRLMKRFGLDTLYGCDAPGLSYTLAQLPDTSVFHPYLNRLFENYDWESTDPLDSLYGQWYAYDDRLSVELPLLDYFRYMNSPDHIRRMHGAYLVGDFKLPGFQGADALVVHWYSRNLRIFRNIQDIGVLPDDRVLVLFGAGHISILKEQFSASPEYQLVDFGTLGN